VERIQAGERESVEFAVRALFDALASHDEPALVDVVTEGFYAFDGGRRVNGAGLMALVRDARAAGYHLSWGLGPMDVQVSGDIAWAAWENTGQVGRPPEVREQIWLESAALHRVDLRWRLAFLHSTAVRSPVRPPRGG
jgi:hypothetical protein